MSSRLTKKSVVSVPCRSVRMPAVEPLALAPMARRPPIEHRQLGSGQPEQVGAVQQQGLRRKLLALAQVVAEAVRPRLEHRERLDVGVLLRGVGPPGANGTVMSWPASFAAFSTAAPPASTIRSASEIVEPDALNSCWIPSRVDKVVASSAGSLTAQPRCGSRRIRAPFAPPRMSVPRNDAADAHAARTSWGTDRPESRTVRLECGDVGVTDQLVVGRRHRVLPQLRLRHPRAEVARHRSHVAVQQLEPGLGERAGELLRVLEEVARHLLVRRVEPQREVGRQHRRTVLP